MVDAVDNGREIAAGRCRNQNLFGARVEVRLALRLGSKEAGALENDINPQLPPGKILGVSLFVNPNIFAINGQGILVALDCMAGVSSLHAVVLQKIGQHLGIGQVVDGDNLKLFIPENLAEGKPSDSAEPIDCNFNHSCDPPT